MISKRNFQLVLICLTSLSAAINISFSLALDKRTFMRLRSLKKAFLFSVPDLFLERETMKTSCSFPCALSTVATSTPRTPAHHDVPFGGRQVIVSGDPFQLEPFFDIAENNKASAFESRCWRQCFGAAASGKFVLLSENHRQASDDLFYSMLSRVRKGRQTDKDMQTLNGTSTSASVPPPSHTRLVLTNEEAAEINSNALNSLQGELIRMCACDTVFTKNTLLEKQAHLRLTHAAPKIVSSKIGARVVLTTKQGSFYPGTEMVVLEMKRVILKDGINHSFSLICALSEGCKNGGNISPETVEPLQIPIHDKSGVVIACREQVPVIPAYAITVHRSQSLSLDKVAIDFKYSVARRWAPEGLVYVALSRCRCLSGLWIRGLEHDYIQTSQVAHHLMHEIAKIMQADDSRVITGPQVAMDLVIYLSLELSKRVGDMARLFLHEKRKRRRIS